MDNNIKLWDVEKGKEIKIFTGHSDLVHSVAFSKDNKYIISGSLDNSIKLWDVASGEELLSYEGEAPIICVCFSPDGQEIWAADKNSAPRIYVFRVVF